MRRAVFMTLGASLVALVAACGGGGAVATQLPAPGATPAPGAQATPAAPPPVDVSAICNGLPTFSLSTPQPSFRTDAELNAKFPTSIGGQPVTRVQSQYWIDFLCYYPNNGTAIGRFVSVFGSNLTAVTIGSGHVELDGNDITLNALRVGGGDAGTVVQHIGEFLLALGADPATIQGMQTSSTNLGGKNVTVVTDEQGDTTYIYASGDTAWSVADVTPEEAGTIFAALP